MNKNIKDMLDGVLASDGDAFTQAFDKEITDRITDKLAAKHVDVTSDILKPDNDQENAE
tara:strand:+ start:1044 stop:1220 length:177 start_codon:yes stop_codon:yes gene_type:complete